MGDTEYSRNACVRQDLDMVARALAALRAGRGERQARLDVMFHLPDHVSLILTLTLNFGS